MITSAKIRNKAIGQRFARLKIKKSDAVKAPDFFMVKKTYFFLASFEAG